MPFFTTDNATIHYEEFGTGFPVLLFAPGGMRSSMPIWQRAPWDPRRELQRELRVIAMDQRNAGESRASITAHDGWHTYTEDHVRLLDHLGIERCHVLGGCIGSSYCLALAQAAPDRVVAAVLQQPIGLSPTNRDVFYELFDSWATELRDRHPEVPEAAWQSFREHMYGGDFVFSVSRDFVRRCPKPLLVLMGNDVYHPSETSREIVALAPNTELIEAWKEPDTVGPAVQRVRAFLKAHTPRAE